MEKICINYRSDFAARIPMDTFLGVPFDIRFRTLASPHNHYCASYDGENYVNCLLVGNWLEIRFDNHGLGIGQLLQQITLHIPDENYPDGVHDVCLDELPVLHHDSESDEDMEVFLEYVNTTTPLLLFVVQHIDAPDNGFVYGRVNGKWVKLIDTPWARIEDAPDDGNIYARINENWIKIS